jgi:hypothetical protein
MGQFESILDKRERLTAPRSPNSQKTVQKFSSDTALPRDEAQPMSPESPPSSPTGSSGSLPSGLSTPKNSPSRSLLSFLQTSEKRLIEAAKRGDDDEVSDLLTDGTNVNTKTTMKKETPLHKAAQYGNISTTLLLLLNGADPRAVGNVFSRKEPINCIAQCPSHQGPSPCMHTVPPSAYTHTRVFSPSDSLGHTPRESLHHRSCMDIHVTFMISGLLTTCELLLYDLLESHGLSLRIGPAGQLIVIRVSNDSIAAAHGI